ncbi:MAG: DJ-1/PfpI family protein [Alphaproteobacteria bacterium]|nr:DJ-1/PfpI family protein [Alphaproteobacteria bacterium]
MQIGFVLFPHVTQLDLTGPLQVLHRMPGAHVHIVAKTMELVPSDCGLSLAPTTTFLDCPPLDILCVPGGFGVSDAIADPALMAFVRAQAGSARFVTSVCTGAFVLGAAGLLAGKRATTHWAYHALLSETGAVATKARVVQDGRLVTGGGVTAGIDFAFALVEMAAGPQVARSIQTALEYDPAPAVSFEEAAVLAGEEIVRFYARRAEEFGAQMRAAMQKL